MQKIFIRRTSVLDNAIDRSADLLSACEEESEEYQNILSNLERLIRLKKEEKSNHVSPDTIAIVGGNLLGILIMVGYERAHVITSRALQLLLRTRFQ